MEIALKLLLSHNVELRLCSIHLPFFRENARHARRNFFRESQIAEIQLEARGSTSSKIGFDIPSDVSFWASEKTSYLVCFSIVLFRVDSHLDEKSSAEIILM